MGVWPMGGKPVAFVSRPQRVSIEDEAKLDDRYLVDNKGAARILCVSTRLVDELRKRGELPSTTVGHCIRYLVSDLQEYALSRRGRAANGNCVQARDELDRAGHSAGEEADHIDRPGQQETS